jgi:hypothetical protein
MEYVTCYYFPIPDVHLLQVKFFCSETDTNGVPLCYINDVHTRVLYICIYMYYIRIYCIYMYYCIYYVCMHILCIYMYQAALLFNCHHKIVLRIKIGWTKSHYKEPKAYSGLLWKSFYLSPVVTSGRFRSFCINL